MKTPKAEDVKRGIAVLWETLQCPICLDLMTTPVSTKCDHQFCKFCMEKVLNNTKEKEANCPICKSKITRRGLQESPGFQRLVAGLQDMIQAYEYDSGTNYFTGLSLKRRQSIITDNENKDHAYNELSEDKSGKGLANEEHDDNVVLPDSNSSTMAAKHGFASLMGFEDSSPFTVEDDGLDSGLGDAPPPSERKVCVQSPTVNYVQPFIETEISQVVERATSCPKTRGKNRMTHIEDSASHLILIPDEKHHQPLRQSSRISNKLQLNSDNNFRQKQQKSLEKVAEWLMKVPTTEEGSELQRHPKQSLEAEPSASPTESGESGSSTSTIQLNQDNSDVNHKREEHSKGLEEQVFGAVYKRERRGKRSFPPRKIDFSAPPVPPLPEETPTLKNIPKKRENKDLTPADFVKKSKRGDKNESISLELTQMQQPTSDTAHFKETESMLAEFRDDSKTTETNGEEKCPYIDNNKADEVNGPTFVLDQPETTKKHLHDHLHNVDIDLQRPTDTTLDSSDKKKTGKKKSKNAKPDKGKLLRMSKPLELVCVQEGEYVQAGIPKTRPGTAEIHVQIESYPSSEELGTPVTRSSRNRIQLQVFTNKVQESHKKKLHASKSKNVNICDADSNVVKQDKKAKSTSDDMMLSHDRNIVKLTQINGCICIKDIGGIENMEFNESTPTPLNLTETVTLVKESIADISNAQSPHNAGVSLFAAEVPASLNPIEATVQVPVLENVNHASPSSNSVVFENVQNETSACTAQCADIEKEEDKNDSELDTEQLLKSFRGTKRKSFLLGSPNVKKNNIRSHKEDLTSSKTEDMLHVGSGTEPSAKDVFNGTKESDVIHEKAITPHLQSHDSSKLGRKHRKGLKRAINSKSDHVMMDSSNPNASGKTQDHNENSVLGNTLSSGLSPNKVAKSQPESNISCVMQAVDSEMLFPALGSSVDDIKSMTPESSKHDQFTENKRDRAESYTGNVTHLKQSISPATEAVTEITCTEKSVELVGNTEASLTPDGLVSQAEQLFEQTAADAQGSGDFSASSPIKSNAKKRRTAQRLDSSSSSENSEEELPSLAQIFKISACPSAVKQASVLVLEDGAQDQRGSRLKAEGFVDECVVADAPLSASLDMVHSSQGSVDLFGTQDESDVPGNDIGVSMESSQFSSEVLVTQQKIAMKEELVRLEKMIGLVSEVLHEKEGNPAAEVPSDISLHNQGSTSTAGLLHISAPCDQETISLREVTPDVVRELRAAPSDSRASHGLASPQASASKLDNILPAVALAENSRLTRQSIKGSGATNEKPTNQTTINSRSLPEDQESKETNGKATTTSLAESKKCRAKFVFVSSGLGPSEQVLVKKFAKKLGGHVVSQVTGEVTHIIIRTDGQLVCERTLKYFMGIAGRKWVVSYQWISECFKQGQLLDESPFEVRGDVVNGPNHQGPMKARITGDDHLLMKGYKFCFQGQFTDMTTDQMEWMVQLCGADIVKDPLLFNESGKSLQLLIVQGGSESAQCKHSALQRRATVLTRGWLLDTLATYTLQNLNAYRA